MLMLLALAGSLVDSQSPLSSLLDSTATVGLLQDPSFLGKVSVFGSAGNMSRVPLTSATLDFKPFQRPCPMDCYPADCRVLYNQGYRGNGVYQIYPAGPYTPAVNVYCDMTTDGGGWTVFQRRLDGSVNFYRNWNDYKNGFGVANGEYWLGLEILYTLTKMRLYELRIDLQDFTSTSVFAKYATVSFSPYAINGEEDGYKLYVSGFTNGGAGDSLSYHSGAKFTTYDRDQDLYSFGNCASMYSGAFWYKSCHFANLNGLYLGGFHASYANGVNWYHWKGYYYSVKVSEMKIR